MTLSMPSKELSLDEMTVAFKGRSTLKLYNKNKPDKYGYKDYVPSDAGTGYVLKWNMHVGAQEDPDNPGRTHVNVSLLLRPENVGKGHTYKVYMDSYYTSSMLAQEFSEN